MGKEGKANFKLVVSILFFSLLMAFLAIGVRFDDTYRLPANLTINTTTRNINFTFNVTWDFNAEVVSNCSLWTNFSGTWESNAEFNGTREAIVHNGSANISNASISWINYTFTHDIGLMVWSIGCRNGTLGIATNLTFNANRTLAIDTNSPTVVQTADIFQGFNTTSTTPTITINITDVNGTGVNLTINGNNATLNFTLYNVNSGADSAIAGNLTLVNSTFLSCSPSGDSMTSTQCTLNINNLPLSNGTKNISIKVADRGGNVNFTSFTFTVDQIPPRYDNLSIMNAVGTSGTLINDTPSNTGAQGKAFYVVSNWTDNLTQPFEIRLQIRNDSNSNTWFNVNYTNITPWTHSGWGNLSYVPSQGHNIFEGKNISIRVNATDSLGNVNISSTLLLQVNDTTKPTLTITLPTVNGTNQSSTILTVNWSIDENNPLTEINISVDGVGISTGFDPNICNKYIRYHTGSGTNVETVRNGTYSTTGGSVCGLTNGSHYVVVQATDSWGNSIIGNRTFNVQSGTKPGLSFNLSNAGAGIWGKSAINKTNITSLVGITLFGDNGIAASIDKIVYLSSCASAAVTVDNNTLIYPFNTSQCSSSSANQTLAVTINDTAGNFNSTVLGFMVDSVGPTITVHSPTPGFSTTGRIDVNISAFDGESQIEWINYYLDGGLTLLNHTQNGSALTGSFGRNTTSINRTINFTAGTHTIKVSVNDTLGNIMNSSVITFTYRGPFDFLSVNKSLMTAAPTNYSNVSVFNSSGNLISDTSATRTVDETFRLFFALSTSKANINVSINFNGSAANWDALNFTIGHNDTKYIPGIQNNFTAQIVELISFNTSSDGFTDSIDDFLTDSNSYYGFIDLTLNATNVSNTKSGGGNLGGTFKLLYFGNETALNSEVNITECTQNKVITHKTTTASDSNFPCWNNTLNASVRVYVPHFSAVALVNDTRPPTVSINYPKNTQTESVFIANITVSNDAVLCNVSYVGASTKIDNKTMPNPTTFGNDKICTYTLDNVTNGTIENNNITFNVWDANNNLNTTVFNFNVSDTTVQNMTAEPTSVGSTTGATITYTANESVNVTVRYYSVYATINLGTNVSTGATDFAKTQEITILGLSTVTSATLWYYNTTACDKAGNCIRNGTYNFTQSATAAAAAAAAAASSGGGGGGAVPVSTVADSKAQVWQTIPAGSSITLNVGKATIAVTSVAVSDIKSELKNVELEVAALKENPVSTEAAAKVYQYLRITKKNLADTDAGSFKISFRVTKAWLAENKLASADIALYRFKDVWNELSTKVTGTDDTYVNYEAETHGFSSFAIGVKSGVVVEEQIPEGEEVPTEEVPKEEAAPPEIVEKPVPVKAPSKAPTAWIIAAVVIILGIILIVAYQKKKQ